MRYLDFEIEIAPGTDGDYPVEVIRSPAGEARGSLRLPYDAGQLAERLRDIEMAILRSGTGRRKMMSPDVKAVRSFGSALSAALLANDVRTAFEISRREASDREMGLRVKLHIRPPELAALPWEFLYDVGEEEYLCLKRSNPLVRYLELPRFCETLAIEPPLQVLGMVAAPSDQDPVDVANEQRRLSEALAPLSERGLVAVDWVPDQTWRGLQRALRRRNWHVFHFIGHGMYDPEQDEGLLALGSEDGTTYPLTSSQLGRLLGDQPQLRLAVLNSCEGARSSSSDMFSSTAAVLMRRGLPAVLAMQYEITDRAAVEFSRAFYEAVADGQPVEAAVTEARIAVSLAIPHTLEWAVPVLHLRAGDGLLFSLPTSAGGTSAVPPALEPTTSSADEAKVRSLAVPTREDLTPAAGRSVRPVRARLAALPRVIGHRRLLAAAFVAVLVLGTTAVLVRDRPAAKPAPGAPTLLWRFDAGGHISGRPAVAGGLVYAGSQDGRVLAVDATTGRLRWSFDTGKIVFSSPTVADGLVYVGSRDGNLYALNAATGAERWRFATTTATQAGFDAPTGVQSSPAVSGGVVYVGADDSRVYAVDAQTGQRRWLFEAGQEVLSSPAVGGGAVVVGSFDGSVYALDAQQGLRRWQFRTGGQVWSSPVLAGGVVYVGSNDKALYALDAGTGQPRWQFPTAGVVSSSPALANGIVYVGSFDHRVYAVDATTGKQRWAFATGNVVFSSPAVANGVVYVGSHDGNVYAIDANSGTERWHFATKALVGSSPTVVDGVVYVGSDDGGLYAIRTPPGG